MAPINPVYWEESRWKRHSVTEERAEDNEEQTTLTIPVKELNRERPLLQQYFDKDHKTIPQKQSQHLKKKKKKCLEIRNKKILYLFIYFLYELQSHEALWMM